MDAITMNQLMQEGQPFMIILDTAADDAEKTFVLDDDSYDGVSGYFENMMLWVSAFKVIPGSGDTIEALRFDEKLVWEGENADEGIDLSGVPYESATPIGFASANVKSRYGVPFLPIRNKFSLKNEAGAVAASRVILWGVATPRTA